MLLEVTNITNSSVERAGFKFKPGETRVIELDPQKSTKYRELDGATALRVVDLGAGEMKPLADTGEKHDDRAGRLRREHAAAKAEAENLRRELDQARADVAECDRADEGARRNAALAGEALTAVKASAPAARQKVEDLEYRAWASSIRELEAERDYHLSLVPAHRERDRQADRRVKDAEAALEAAKQEAHDARVAAGRLGYEANREESLARSAAGKLAQLKRKGERG